MTHIPGIKVGMPATAQEGNRRSDGSRTSRHQLWGDRSWVKLLASQIALDIVRRHVLGLPPHEAELFRRR